MKTLFALMVTFGAVCVAAQPCQAAGHLSAPTIKAWCNAGHGAQTATLDPQTWNYFDLLAANAETGMTRVPDAYANDPSGFWELNASVMGGAGSEAEDVLLAWLREIANAARLTHNVDSLRAIADKLREAVDHNPGMFYNSADNIARTRKALTGFARFEKAVDTFAPDLSHACAAPQARRSAGSAARTQSGVGGEAIGNAPAQPKAAADTGRGTPAVNQAQAGSQNGSWMGKIKQKLGNMEQQQSDHVDNKVTQKTDNVVDHAVDNVLNHLFGN